MFPRGLYAKGLVASCCCLSVRFPSIGSCARTVALQLLELFGTVSTSRRSHLPGGSDSLLEGCEIL